MKRKLIILIISIIVPILGTVGIALYDYNIYYNPTGDNSAELQTKYKEYVTNKLVDVVGNEEYVKQTQGRIALFRAIHSYYYGDEAIYSKTVEYNGETLFMIDVYKDVSVYTPSTEQAASDRIRYEVYIYSVNYTLLREMYMGSNVLPNDKNLVEKSAYPSLIINFYPTEECNEEDALITSAAGAGYTYTLYNSDNIYGSKLNSAAGYTLYDYNSTPTFSESEEPFRVQYFGFNDYSSIININDDSNTNENDDRSRFNDGAYIKIDSVLETSSGNYSRTNSILTEKIDGMNFNLRTLDLEEYNSGFQNNVTEIKIDGVQTYTAWITGRYVWWQCLIALVAFGAIMTGFYFTFTYEEKNQKSNKKGNTKK